MTQEAQDKGQKERKGIEAWSGTRAMWHATADKIAKETHKNNHTQEAQDKSVEAHQK